MHRQIERGVFAVELAALGVLEVVFDLHRHTLAA
jgi:hypothetical protein